MEIRVSRIKYEHGQKIIPTYKNYEIVEVMTKSSKYGQLSPYCLTDDRRRIIENVWQFSKVYENVPYSKQKYSRYDNTIIWEHPSETHLNNNKLTKEYKNWRKKGMNNSYPVRYPVGFNYRHNCLFAYWKKERLDYLDARQKIYVPLYINSVKKEPLYRKLVDIHKERPILIVEVDGPHQESLEYYKETFNVKNDFIENDTMSCTPENLTIMLNDEKHPFGHGYCLAMALQNFTI